MNRVLIAGIVNNLSAALAACIAEPDATQIPTWGEAGKDWREFVMQEVDKKLANPDATLLLLDPHTFAFYRLGIRYLHTQCL